MATQPKRLSTLEEYLDQERAAAYKSEFYAGVIYAMAGGTEVHARLAAQIASLLWLKLQGRCRIYGSDLNIYLEKQDQCVYADAMVICGSPSSGASAKTWLSIQLWSSRCRRLQRKPTTSPTKPRLSRSAFIAALSTRRARQDFHRTFRAAGERCVDCQSRRPWICDCADRFGDFNLCRRSLPIHFGLMKSWILPT